MHLGIIGYGNIATSLLARLTDPRISRITVLVRPGRDAHGGTSDIRFVTELDALIAGRPDLVVECAGHGAVASFAPALLRAGHDVVIASVGALADRTLHAQINEAAAQGGAMAILPNGAIGGLDMLRVLTASGPVDVTYRGTKPPEAWRGSPAEAAVDLGGLREATTFFCGTGREAALAYPKNANVVAALALAGAGFDRMRVELVADPQATANQHSYRVDAPDCQYSMVIEAKGSAGNARTSVTTVLSILQEISAYQVRP
ncbi:MAG: aspartate dehydrogenase [Pseudomonadota bacterium]